MAVYQSILLAVDFSPGTEVLLNRARALSAALGARLSMVHVVEPLLIDPAYELLPALPAEFEEQLEEGARKQLARLATELQVKSNDTYLRNGSTKSEILAVAESTGADLILLGRHGRHGVARLLGSTANAVLHAAKCDVLTVRLEN